VSTDVSDPTGGTAPSNYATITFKTGGTDGLANANSADQLNAAAQAFNDAAGKTGFTAKIVKTENGFYGIQLTSEAGKDLRIYNDSVTANSAGSSQDVALEDIAVLDGDKTNTADALGLTVAAQNAGGVWTGGNGDWVTGQLILDSNKSFSFTTTTGEFATGTAAGTYGGALQAVDRLDVSSYDAALRTLTIVDSALSSVNDQRARYGALQTRFENTISNLQTTSEMLSASRSRIQDADYAAETANLTRAQILQQAGTAILAQANAVPNNVLTLLR